jgi:prephenate dehydrogenase
MTQFQARTVAFVGLGLISGSLARALQSSTWQGNLIAWGPREASLKRGRALGVVDDYSLVLEEVIEQADVIVVGAPPAATASILSEIIGKLAVTQQQPIITDLASIKGYVVDSVDHDYPHFVPGHPIAGSEHSGVEYSDAGLFAGREVILTPLTHTAATAVAQIEAMWALTGAYIRAMEVQQHDALLAASSHMPHVVAYALTRALERDASDPMIHGGGALRDMTRIAGSDPRMWTDIAVTNRQALLAAMDQFDAEMTMLRELVDRKDERALEDYFSICRAHRRDHDSILNPISETAPEENHEV